MNSDLYSLPKDMLVKLVSTIREDTVKEYEEKLKDLEEELKIYEKVELAYCDILECPKKWPNTKAYNDDYLLCWNCGGVFCKDHIKMYPKLCFCEECDKEK